MIHRTPGRAHWNVSSLSSVAAERSNELVGGTKRSYEAPIRNVREGCTPGELQVTLRYSRVSQHPDTKSVVESKSAPWTHISEILVKWRPSGRSNNRRAVGQIPHIAPRSRDPVSFGEVEGVIHMSEVFS